MAARLKNKKRTYHHGALKQGLVEAASDLIKKRGHIGFNLRDLAKECQVSAPAVYRHFNSKNALMVAIAKAGFESILSRFKSELPSRDSMGVKERLVRLGEIYIHFAIKNEGQFRVMFSRELCQIPDYKSIEPIATQSFAFLKELISDVLPQKISEADRQTQIMRSWGLVHGLANLRIDGNFDNLSEMQFNNMIRAALSF
jgi:AcrR family transcriptional regulator